MNEICTHTDGSLPFKQAEILDYLEPLAKMCDVLRHPQRLEIIRHLAEMRSSTLQGIVEAMGHQWESTNTHAQVARRHLRALEEQGFVSHEREYDGKIPYDNYFFKEEAWRRFCGLLLFNVGISPTKELLP